MKKYLVSIKLFIIIVLAEIAFGPNVTYAQKNNVVRVGIPNHTKSMKVSTMFNDLLNITRAVNKEGGFETKFIPLPAKRIKEMLIEGQIDLEVARIENYNRDAPSLLKSKEIFTTLNLTLLKIPSHKGPYKVSEVMKEGHLIAYPSSILLIQEFFKDYSKAIPLEQEANIFDVLKSKRVGYLLTFAFQVFENLISKNYLDRAEILEVSEIINSANTYTFFNKDRKNLMELYDKHLTFNSPLRRKVFASSKSFQMVKDLPKDHMAKQIYLKLIQCDESIFKEKK